MKRNNMKTIKLFLIAVLEAFTSALKIKPTTIEDSFNFEEMSNKTDEQLNAETHELLNVITKDYDMTMVVKKLFFILCLMSLGFGINMFIVQNWSVITFLLISFACYKLYDDRRQMGDAKHSFIQFYISNEIELEKAKKNPGYQMRHPGFYEDNLS